jgi:hypothetical protein
MPVISSTVAQITEDGPGLVQIREEHTLQSGRVMMYRYQALDSANHDLLLPDHAAAIEVRAKRDEKAAAIEWVLAGNSPDTFTAEFNTGAELLKALLKYMMSSRDLRELTTLIDWIDVNVSDAQLDAVLTQAGTEVRDKIRARVNNAVPIIAALLADESYLVKVE